MPDCDLVHHPTRSDGPQAAVIIPARNAERHIGRCLEALQRDGAPIEIIVVDDASADATAAIAEAKGARVVRLRMQSGPGAARNAGVAVSEADIVIFVDADVEVAPGSLTSMLAFLEDHPECAAVFGSYDDSPGGASTVSKYRDLIFHYRHQTGRTEADTFWSGFSAVRREPFLSVGGFASGRQDGIEDIELGARLRAASHRIALQRGLLCKHHKHWTLRSMIYIDLFKRALPWSRLLLERKCWAGDLNLRRDRRFGVALAGAGSPLRCRKPDRAALYCVCLRRMGRRSFDRAELLQVSVEQEQTADLGSVRAPSGAFVCSGGGLRACIARACRAAMPGGDRRDAQANPYAQLAALRRIASSA